MRRATINTLSALLEGKRVTAFAGPKLGTTRVSNEIVEIRHRLGIKVITQRIKTKNGKWYGVYRLDRSWGNAVKAKNTLQRLLRGSDERTHPSNESNSSN